MKLYTEEQVLNALALAHSHIKPLQYVVDMLKPIELPTDEEIEKKFTIGTTQKTQYTHKIEGAKWMRYKIQGGDL